MQVFFDDISEIKSEENIGKNVVIMGGVGTVINTTRI